MIPRSMYRSEEAWNNQYANGKKVKVYSDKQWHGGTLVKNVLKRGDRVKCTLKDVTWHKNDKQKTRQAYANLVRRIPHTGSEQDPKIWSVKWENKSVRGQVPEERIEGTALYQVEMSGDDDEKSKKVNIKIYDRKDIRPDGSLKGLLKPEFFRLKHSTEGIELKWNIVHWCEEGDDVSFAVKPDSSPRTPTCLVLKMNKGKLKSADKRKYKTLIDCLEKLSVDLKQTPDFFDATYKEYRTKNVALQNKRRRLAEAPISFPSFFLHQPDVPPEPDPTSSVMMTIVGVILSLFGIFLGGYLLHRCLKRSRKPRGPILPIWDE